MRLYGQRHRVQGQREGAPSPATPSKLRSCRFLSPEIVILIGGSSDDWRRWFGCRLESPDLQGARQHPANSGRRPGRETSDGRITVEEKKSSEEPGVFSERRCVQRRCTVDWIPLVQRNEEDGNSENQGARNLGQ
ncbi:hypothetical protein U1Q18_022120 [Sarracenia purpurea var. burkii]